MKNKFITIVFHLRVGMGKMSLDREMCEGHGHLTLSLFPLPCPRQEERTIHKSVVKL